MAGAQELYLLAVAGSCAALQPLERTRLVASVELKLGNTNETIVWRGRHREATADCGEAYCKPPIYDDLGRDGAILAGPRGTAVIATRIELTREAGRLELRHDVGCLWRMIRGLRSSGNAGHERGTK